MNVHMECACTCRQALFAMPHRAMYMLAYWSRLWNKAASYRVRKYGGKRVVEGDLVCSWCRARAQARDVCGIARLECLR